MTTTEIQTDHARMRTAMVASQLRTNAVSDARVVDAMARVPRELFVPDGQRAFAYRDAPIPLGDARFLNLPIATGRLLTAAAIGPDDRVLLIGAATGYTAAVIAELAAGVVAVEVSPGLADVAREVLAADDRVRVVAGALGEGADEGAPYDVLVIDGAVPQVPEALIRQVRVGGRLAAGLIDRGVTRLTSGRRSEGGFGLVAFADVECVLLPGFDQPVGFRF